MSLLYRFLRIFFQVVWSSAD